MFGIPKYISVPVAAFLVWIIVLRWPFRTVEKFFLVLSVVYIAYPLSGIAVGAPWNEVFRAMFTPTFQLDPGYILVFIAVVGTTITPWGQFFIQAYVVDKGIGPREYHLTRIDVLAGALVTNVVSFFIIVATASTLYVQGIQTKLIAQCTQGGKSVAQAIDWAAKELEGYIPSPARPRASTANQRTRFP
jgi:Mn2+/Fe2+ NRAMP family transporter